MSSTSGGKAGGSGGFRHGGSKTQVWEDSPHTLTEFGALSSDMKPSGNFLTRLWRRNKENSPNQTTISPAGSVSGLDTNAVEVSTKAQPLSSNGSSSVSGPDKVHPAPEGSGMARPESLSSLQDSTSVEGSGLPKFEGSEEVLESQVSQRPQHRTLTSVLNRLGSILDQRSTGIGALLEQVGDGRRYEMEVCSIDTTLSLVRLGNVDLNSRKFRGQVRPIVYSDTNKANELWRQRKRV
ncbi:hypothetical protein ElyMa_003710700 [Elysia marginata]|uniref:Uncharacterized protein n=1 Tax=Elysia marginata TaxID=1093978 RepID=A0AAV4F315_9GAST|nr:hypothetical protein ElyMa_003710700 [Elysia marginata]